MRERIWGKYNREQVQMGSITFFIDKKTFQSIKNFKRKSTGGRPQEFHPTLIEFLLVLKIQYTLSYRRLEGFARSIFGHKVKIPTYTTICKRAKQLALSLPKLSSRKAKVVLIDASGVKVFGEGEWKRKIHGVGRPRQWVKLHIAVDEESQEVVAEVLTDSRTADCAMLSSLLDAGPKSIEVVKADGAYDRKSSRDAMSKKGIRAVIPPPKNARVKGVDKERDDSVLQIIGLGGDLRARSLWGKLTGYSYRALAETAFSRYKRLFGGRLFSQGIERQRVENRLKWMMLNKMLRVS